MCSKNSRLEHLNEVFLLGLQIKENRLHSRLDRFCMGKFQMQKLIRPVVLKDGDTKFWVRLAALRPQTLKKWPKNSVFFCFSYILWSFILTEKKITFENLKSENSTENMVKGVHFWRKINFRGKSPTTKIGISHLFGYLESRIFDMLWIFSHETNKKLKNWQFENFLKKAQQSPRPEKKRRRWKRLKFFGKIL
jgi:hypothetical protein